MQNWVPTRWLIAGEWRAHPVRMGLAVLAIVVGVALGFAVHMVNSAALASFGRAVASVQGRADVAVRARSTAGLDEGLYPKLARLPALQAISPVVELTASWGKLARPGSSAKGGRFTLIGLDPLRAMSVTPGPVAVGPVRRGQPPGVARRCRLAFAGVAACHRVAAGRRLHVHGGRASGTLHRYGPAGGSGR